MRRNCTQGDDYAIQAQVLKKRFLEKGYDTTVLDMAINEMHKVPLKRLFDWKNEQKVTKHEWGFISAYHAQYKEVEAI